MSEMGDITRSTREGTTEYFTDRGVRLYVFRGNDGYMTVQIAGEQEGPIQMRLVDVPRLIQALEWALRDDHKAGQS